MEEKLPKISITKEGETKTYEAQHIIILFEDCPDELKTIVDIGADFSLQLKSFKHLTAAITGAIKKSNLTSDTKGQVLMAVANALGDALDYVIDNYTEELADFVTGEMITDVRGSSVQRVRGSRAKGTQGTGNSLKLV